MLEIWPIILTRNGLVLCIIHIDWFLVMFCWLLAAGVKYQRGSSHFWLMLMSLKFFYIMETSWRTAGFSQSSSNIHDSYVICWEILHSHLQWAWQDCHIECKMDSWTCFKWLHGYLPFSLNLILVISTSLSGWFVWNRAFEVFCSLLLAFGG